MVFERKEFSKNTEQVGVDVDGALISEESAAGSLLRAVFTCEAMGLMKLMLMEDRNSLLSKKVLICIHRRNTTANKKKVTCEGQVGAGLEVQRLLQGGDSGGLLDDAGGRRAIESSEEQLHGLRIEATIYLRAPGKLQEKVECKTKDVMPDETQVANQLLS